MAQLIKAVIDTQKNSYRSIGQVNAADDLELELEVKMNGQPIEFINPECELLIKKSDNNKVRQTKDIIYQDGKFKIKVDEQGVTCTGIVVNQLTINDGGRISTCLFYFMVATSLDGEILKSISKVEVLEQLEEYIVTAFANLKDFEEKVLSSDETIRKLNYDMNESEKIRDTAELQRQETFKSLKENMNEAITNLESSINLSNMNEKERSEVFNSLKSNLESIKQDLINLNASVESEEEKRVQAEINRVNKALEIIEKLESTNNSVATAEAERVSEFNKIKTENNTLKEALTTINNTANSNEEVRKENETSRVEAEKARVNEFNTMKLENETFKQEINEQYEDIVTEFDKVIANVTNGNENATNSEIVQARGKEVNLNARLDNFDEQLDNKANKYKSEIIGIKGWRQPNQDKKIVFVGDSTTDSALSIYSEIKKYYINSGDCLSGINESNLINKGANGNTIANFINNIPSGKGINDVIALKPDLIIFCYGINDVRLGNTTLERLIELHDNAITRLLKETNAYILLRTPHPLCSDSPNGFIQPSDAGQQYTDILWECYEHFRGKYPKTDVLDLQTLVFGRVSKNVADSPLMADELHANNIGQAREGSVIADFIGEKPKKDSYKARNSISYTDYPKLLEDNPLYEKICEAYFMNMGNNYLDIYLPKDKISLIQKGDILKIGDELACEFTGTTSVNGNYVRILNTFTNYDKNKKGMVEVYRVKKNKENIGFGANSISTNGVFDQFYCFNKNIVITNFIIKSNFPIPNGATFTLSSTHNGTKTDICDITFTHNNMNGSFVWLNNITSKIVETYDFLTLTCKSITYTGQVRISIILE